MGFLYFSAIDRGGQTPQLNFTQNGLDDMDSRKDVPFAVKIAIFQTPNPQTPKTTKIWAILDKIFDQNRL